MNNQYQFKSVKSLVSEIVTQFIYKDFEPGSNLSAAKQKFIDTVSREDAYWKILKESENPEWCILALKSHNQYLHLKTKICFSFKHDRIRIVVCNDPKILQSLEDGYLISSQGLHVDLSIFYRNFWKNHEKLYVVLLDVFETSLEYADREKAESPFPGSTLAPNKELEEVCV